MDLAELTSRSYVPYSGKPSVSVVKSLKGNYYPGIRLENASFPLTISAAQNALYCCLSEGEQPKALYVDNTRAKDIPFWQQEYNVWVYSTDELDDGVAFAPILLEKKHQKPNSYLKDLLEKAVVINSDFPVSALVETPEGYVAGVNIECSQWEFGLCAERIALGKALTYGYAELQSLHIHTRHGEFSSPCGACRQVILEHMARHPIHLHHANGTHSKHFSSDLLPHSFHSSSLRKDP